MLSIQKIRDIDYYDNLQKVDDYYVDARTDPGSWLGGGATLLGLAGDVSSADLRAVFAGFAPDGAALVQNAGKAATPGRPGHRPGWDLTFSAPKSVSVIWGLGTESTRRAVETAHRRAVELTLRVAEAECAFSRRGKGGRLIEPCSLTIASFQHGTSRALDPNLHSHCLIANVGHSADGATRTLHSQQFYRWKMTLGKLYQTELAYQLGELAGASAEATKDAFEITGVPEKLCSLFSKRRAQILAALSSTDRVGRSSAKAAEIAALATRDKKTPVSDSLLRPAWRQAAAEIGVSPAELEQCLRQLATRVEPSFNLLNIYLDRIIDELVQSKAHFGKQDLLRALGPTAIAQGMSSGTLLAGVNRYLNVSPQIIHLDEWDLEMQYTTAQALEQETELLTAAHRLQEDRAFYVAGDVLEPTLANHAGVKERDEQRIALEYLVGEGRLKLLAGMPGTGKTFVLDAAREAFERAGYRMLGTAIAGKAVRELAEKAHIDADTAAKLLWDFTQTPLDEAGHHVRQLAQAAQDRKTHPYRRHSLDDKTVLVIDEAGMLDTPVLKALLHEAERRGAKVILVGDPEQLPPIGPGAPFSVLLSRYESASLIDIKRQREAADVEAIHALSRGEVDAMLKNYRERGRLAVLVDRRHAVEQLVSDWAAAGGAGEPLKHAIFVATNVDRAAVNDACQRERLLADWAGASKPISIRTKETRAGKSVIVKEDFHVGDPVLCLKRSKAFGLENGTLGAIVDIDRKNELLTLEIAAGDSHRRVVVPITLYPHLTRGYAITAHKGQGQTVDHAYVLLGGTMQARELTYVQISRARESTRLYATAVDAGRDLEGLARMIHLRHEKRMAHELLPTERDPAPEVTMPRPASLEINR